MKLYYLNKGTQEYHKMKGSWKFPPCAFDQGYTLMEDSEYQTIEVFETKEKALNALKEYSTTYDGMWNNHSYYLYAVEYGVQENIFDVEEAIKEEEATDEADFLKKIKANPTDFWRFWDCEQSGYYVAYSVATLTAYVKVEKTNENGKTVTDCIEEEFLNDGNFNAYEQAIEWSENTSEALTNVEDITKVYAIDCGVRY